MFTFDNLTWHNEQSHSISGVSSLPYFCQHLKNKRKQEKAYLLFIFLWGQWSSSLIFFQWKAWPMYKMYNSIWKTLCPQRLIPIFNAQFWIVIHITQWHESCFLSPPAFQPFKTHQIRLFLPSPTIIRVAHLRSFSSNSSLSHICASLPAVEKIQLLTDALQVSIGWQIKI